MSLVSRVFVQENRNTEQNLSAVANFLSSNGFELTKTEVVGKVNVVAYVYLTDTATGCSIYFRQWVDSGSNQNNITFAAISEGERRGVDEISFFVPVSPTTTLPFTFKITLRRGVGTFAIQIAPHNDLDSVNAGSTMLFWELPEDRILYGNPVDGWYYDYDRSTDIATTQNLYNFLDTSTSTQMSHGRVAMNPMYLINAGVIIEEEIPECYGIKHDGSLTSQNVLYKVNNVTYRLIRDNVLYKWE